MCICGKRARIERPRQGKTTRLDKVLEGPSWGKRFGSERGCCCLSRSVCLMPAESVLEKLRLFLPAEAKE